MSWYSVGPAGGNAPSAAVSLDPRRKGSAAGYAPVARPPVPDTAWSPLPEPAAARQPYTSAQPSLTEGGFASSSSSSSSGRVSYAYGQAPPAQQEGGWPQHDGYRAHAEAPQATRWGGEAPASSPALAPTSVPPTPASYSSGAAHASSAEPQQDAAAFFSAAQPWQAGAPDNEPAVAGSSAAFFTSARTLTHRGGASSSSSSSDAQAGSFFVHSEEAPAPAGADGAMAAGGVAARASAKPVPVEHLPGQGTWLDTHAKWVPWLLLALAAATRFYRLDVPRAVVFDELHFGRFTNQYHAGTYLFDIHPPLGKLVFWAVSRVIGYDYRVCDYSQIGKTYHEQCNFMVLRCTSAIYGSITAPLLYFILREWGTSVTAAAFGAFLFITDNLNLGESRLVLMDAQLIFWCAVALYSAQRWWARLNQHVDGETSIFARYGIDVASASPEQAAALAAAEPRLMSVQQHFRWLAWMGFACAMAVSIKWTGLATPAMIALECFFAAAFLRRPLRLADGLVIAGVAAVVYSTWFWIHFALLPRTGDGDGFMRLEFQRTLINNTHYDPKAMAPAFPVVLWQLNREMLAANARISQRHPWESVWWEWIINARGLRMWSHDWKHSYTSIIYLLGNPIVIWLVAASLGASGVLIALYMRLRRAGGASTQALYASLDKYYPTFLRLGYCILAWGFNLLPYLAVNRSCFVYHYMPALMYGEIATALLFDALAGRRWIGRATAVASVLITAAFLHFAPWVYAFPLTNGGHARRRWFKRWD